MPEVLVPGRRARTSQPGDDRDPRPGDLSREVAQQRVHVLTGERHRTHVDDVCRPAVLITVEARVRGTPADRRADVEEIAIPVRPRSEDRVREHHGIRLGPRDVRPEAGALGQLIGRAGPGLRHPESSVESHQLGAVPRLLGRARGQLRMPQVHRPHVRRGRHAALSACVDEALDEVDPAAPVEQAGVDVDARPPRGASSRPSPGRPR